MKENLKKLGYFLAYSVIAIAFFCAIVIGMPKLAKSVYGDRVVLSSESCGIAEDELSLLREAGVEVKVNTWVDCSQAQKALKEHYKNKLRNFQQQVREAVGPVGPRF